MPRTIAAALRWSSRLMSPAMLTKSARSLKKTMNSIMVASVLAPFVGPPSKKTKTRKTTRSKSKRSGAVLARPSAPVKNDKRRAKPKSPVRKDGVHVPDGAQYLSRQHRSTAGSRGYKLYLPSSRPIQPKGIVLMLHGCNQNPDDFAIGTHMNALAEKHGLAIAYPAQTRLNNAASCWNWFKPVNQMRGMGEPAILASMTRKLMREFGLDRKSVFVAGLSAGGSMAAILADIYPDIYSAAGIHSGLARGAASDVVSAMLAMRNGGASKGMKPLVARQSSPVRRIIFQGDTDTTVNAANAAMIVSAVVGDDATPSKVSKKSVRGRNYEQSIFDGSDGTASLELWMLEGTGHAWSGGRVAGSYTDSKGPDASAQMIRFFLAGSD